jgi:uncharacterized protein YhaN
MSKTALAAAAAYSAGKNRNTTMRKESNTFKESVFNRPIAWLMVAGVIGFAVYKFGGSVAEAFRNWQKGRDLDKEYSDKAKTMRLSWSAAQFKIFADTLEDAFVGSPVDPTDEVRIRTVFQQMRNDLDVLELIKVYGKRDIGFFDPERDLISQLQSELSDSDKETYVNNPLRINRVSYQF